MKKVRLKSDHRLTCFVEMLYRYGGLNFGIKMSVLITTIFLSSCRVELPSSIRHKTLSEINYVENNGNRYTLHLTNPESVSKILLNDSPDANLLLNPADSVIRIKLLNKRPEFKVLTQKDTLIVSNRKIDFDRIVNFRDLGGIKTTDGKTVKWGKIFRSDNLSGLKTTEFEKLGTLQIAEVIDLRTDHEIKGKEDNLPGSVRYVHSPTVEDNEGQIAELRAKVIKGEISENEARNQTIAFYRDAAGVNVSSLKGIIQSIVNSNEPILYHCSAGKDRTGIVSALLLSILNVDRQTIMQEYMMSNYYRAEKTEKMMGKAKLAKIIKPQIDLKSIEVFMTVDERFLNAFFEVVDHDYSGLDLFIQNQLGISDTQRKAFIARLTY